MIAESYDIQKYMQRFDKDKREVFILIERKTDINDRDSLNSNFYCKGADLEMLAAMAEVTERVAKQMGLTFDETLEVMKNAHLQDKTVMRTRYKQRIDKEWSVLE